MPQTEDILSTLRMVKQENLDVRTVTMGINLSGCVDRDVARTCDLIARTIRTSAHKLKETCATVSARYGIPIVHRRLAVTPIVRIADGFDPDAMVRIAKVLDESAEAVQVDLIGGYSALVHGGLTAAAKKLLGEPAGRPGDDAARLRLGQRRHDEGRHQHDGRRPARDRKSATSRRRRPTAKDSAAPSCASSPMRPEDNPFMAGGFHGEGSPDTVIHIGVSGPGVVKRALERLHQTLARLRPQRHRRGDQIDRLPRHARGRTDRPRGRRPPGRGVRHRRPVAGPGPQNGGQRGRNPAPDRHRPDRRPRQHGGHRPAQRCGQERGPVRLVRRSAGSPAPSFP